MTPLERTRMSRAEREMVDFVTTAWLADADPFEVERTVKRRWGPVKRGYLSTLWNCWNAQMPFVEVWRRRS